jgi:hypothetical protein
MNQGVQDLTTGDVRVNRQAFSSKNVSAGCAVQKKTIAIRVVRNIVIMLAL